MSIDSLRREVIATLGLIGPSSSEEAGRHRVSQFEWPEALRPAQKAPDSQSDDCQKRGALFAGPRGFECLEAHIVDRLRSAPGRVWDAGWVQAWSCGRATWRDEIWDALPERLAAINSQVQDQRVIMRPGAKRSRLGGHPDVVVVQGEDILYIECKVNDDGFGKQREWCEAAFDASVLQEAGVLIVHADIKRRGPEVDATGVASDETRRDLERRFEADMYEIYERAGVEVGYWATRYLQMLRRRGGLGTAKHLLHSSATSDGYQALRDAGRLDLTVEALVLRPEYEPLFDTAELGTAEKRLARYRQLMAEGEAARRPTNPELVQLLEVVAITPPGRRIEYRDEVASHGPEAIPAMEAWVADGRSPAFAIAVLEAVGRTADPGGATRALRIVGNMSSKWRDITDAAAARIGTARRDPGGRQQPRSAAGEEYIARGTPPPALGACGILNADGSACQNPGRHQIGDALSCTTHYKALTRRGLT